jgi:hypothetical protein
VTQWEYARLEYRSTGSFGMDKKMDWDATFHYPGGVQRWGTDEHFDDLRHLNRAGASGWQAYHRAPLFVGQPHRLHAVTYSLRRLFDPTRRVGVDLTRQVERTVRRT